MIDARGLPAEGPAWNDAAMGDLWTLVRRAMSALVLMTASYYLVVAFDNITNPESNWVFVKGVLSLDGVPADSGFGWRAIDATWFQVVAYVGVIASEATAGALLAIGGIGGLRHSGKHFTWLRPQRFTILGCVVGLLVFFVGFIVVGGNWFVMYLNEKWNGLEPAFQNSMLTLATLICVLIVMFGGRDVPGRPFEPGEPESRP